MLTQKIAEDDSELVSGLKDPFRKERCFKKLVLKYQQRIYWHIRRMVVSHEDSDDLVQETFIKVFRNINRFRGNSELYTWIYRIATNECLTFLKKKRKRFFIPIDDVNQNLINELEQGAYINADEVALKLQKAILRLPDQQRLVFNLKYFDELKYEEISEITGKSIGALKANYHHATKKIESFLTSD